MTHKTFKSILLFISLILIYDLFFLNIFNLLLCFCLNGYSFQLLKAISHIIYYIKEKKSPVNSRVTIDRCTLAMPSRRYTKTHIVAKPIKDRTIAMFRVASD